MINADVQKLMDAGKISKPDAEKLSNLEPGACCQHKSWGVGRIAEWDLLGDRLVADFEAKAGHAMKLSFAVGSLDPLPGEHILAKRVAELPSLQQMAKSDP